MQAKRGLTQEELLLEPPKGTGSSQIRILPAQCAAPELLCPPSPVRSAAAARCRGHRRRPTSFRTLQEERW